MNLRTDIIHPVYWLRMIIIDFSHIFQQYHQYDYIPHVI